MTKRTIKYAWAFLHHAHLLFVARRFRRARVERKFTRTELALTCGFEDLDWGLQCIADIESGDVPHADIWNTRRIAEPLDIDVFDLWEELQRREVQRREAEHAWHPPVLGRRLRAAREARGLTIAEVERRGVFPRHFQVYDIEEGVARFPTDRVLDAFARVLEVDADALREARAEECAFYDNLGAHFADRDCSPIVMIRAMHGTSTIDYPDGLDTAGVLEFAAALIDDDFMVPPWRDPEFKWMSPNRVMIFFPDGRNVSFWGRRAERVEFGACFAMRDGHDWKGEYYAC